MTSDHLRYGVIGTGMMGIEHMVNIAHLDDASVTAFADPDPVSRATAAAVAPEAAIFEDHRALLDSGACDAVVIASPNHTHAEIVLDALATPVHLLIEKPLCTTVADCEAVLDAVHRGDGSRVVWMGLEYRYMPPTRALLDEVGRGTAGTVKMVAIREHRFPFLTKVGNWNRFTRNTGGTLVEKCCHFFDLMNQIIGSTPVRVMASGAQDVNHLDERYDGETPDILDNAYVVVDYAGGERAMLDLCMFAEASLDEQEISVVGDAGKIEAFVTRGILRTGRRSDGRHAVAERLIVDEDVAHVGLHHGASYLEHVAFARAVRSGTPAEVTVTDGLWSVAMGVAGHRSIDLGRPVLLSEVMR